MWAVLRVGRASAKDILERFVKAGARIDRIELDGDKDALAIEFVPRDANPCFTGLGELRRLRYLRLGGTKVTDDGVRNIRMMTSLKSLIIAGTAVTDTGLKELRGLRSLMFLSLAGTQVTDFGLKQLLTLSNLSVLNLENCPGVTDAGIDRLACLEGLEWLNLRGTGVTEEGAVWLRKALPGCTVSSGKV